MSEQLIVIRTLPELQDLYAYLEAQDGVVAFDSETTGIEKDSEIIGFSVCAETTKAYYVVLSYWDVAQQKLVYLETNEMAKQLYALLATKRLVMHNAIFDCDRVRTLHDIDLMPAVYVDTMILAHLVDENRRVGLKELGLSIYGEDATAEAIEMKASISKNGGVITKDKYELYKADSELIARYGAKDAILTLNVLYHILPQLFDQELDAFFFDDESMPLLRGPTYDLNTTGLRIDAEKLQQLKGQLEADCHDAKSFVYKEVLPLVKDKYPGTSKANTFNINANNQLSWLLFVVLKEEFGTLTDGGKEVCEALDMRLPYAAKDKREFIRRVTEMKGFEHSPGAYNPKTKKRGAPKKVKDFWTYTACGKETLGRVAAKYAWAKRLLEYKKNLKLLNTYVEGIQDRMRYNIIRPSFLQHGTTSGRYSSRYPNFQNLPRDDKRIKACIVSRPGKVFVGADYAQLEPRVFASFAADERLLKCFKDGDDFYSVIGAHVFGKADCTMKKDDTPESFPVKYKKLRDVAKTIALATPYGTSAHQMNRVLGRPVEECQQIIDDYFANYPSVEQLMKDSHKQAKENGAVKNLFGRPRRMPAAKDIPIKYGKNTPHRELPYDARNLLNLAMNHRIQSTGASIMNRAAIAAWKSFQELGWTKVKIVLQVHDELVLEGPEELADDMVAVLKHCMENTVVLPGVDLISEPKVAKNLADLK